MKRTLPVIYQSENAECGLACVAMVAAFHGFRVDLFGLRERSHSSMRGVSLTELVKIAKSVNLNSRVVRVTPQTLHLLVKPAILHWDMAHFVVLKAIRRGHAVLHDPNHGELVMPLAEVSHHLTGIAIELTPDVDFKPRDERKYVRLGDLGTDLRSKYRSIALIVVLAIASQALLVMVPYYFQLVIDRTVTVRNHDLLNWLTGLFLLFIGLDWAIKYFRNELALFISTRLNQELSVNLISHLLRLPLAFFGSRNLADLISKLDSVQEVRSIVSEDVVRILVDGLMLIVIFFVLWSYDIRLLAIALAFVGIYIAYRAATFEKFQLVTQEQIVRRVRAKSHLIESLQGMEAIRTFDAGAVRLSAWRSLFVDEANGDFAITRMRQNVDLTRDGLVLLESVVSLYVAAHLLIAGSLTLGMVFAFFSYKRLLITSSTSLTETLIKTRLLQVHLDRLSDVVWTPVEASPAAPLTQDCRTWSDISVQGLSYAYPGDAADVISNLSFTIQQGERAVLVGPSGAGKTTLIKLLLKLMPEQHTSIKVGQTFLVEIPREDWLSRIGVVMQNDKLFSGSLRENIAFGQVEIDDERVREAADLACIADDIAMLPMRYETHIGDMGASLSAGQIQRVVIARALYKKPLLLVMDEGTANLDQETERNILDNLRSLGITLVQAAHRPQVISDATKLIHVIRTRDYAEV